MQYLYALIIALHFAGPVMAQEAHKNPLSYSLREYGLILAIALPGLAAAGTPAGPTPATHIKCPDCRELVLKDARKCKHCGSQLVPIDPNAIRCPSCGDIGKISEKYCASCGHNLH